MVFDRAQTLINKRLFDLQCNKILNTQEIQYEFREDIKIVSQVHHNAINMYLVAIKSFLSFFGTGSVYILDDGSLTNHDKNLLCNHIPNINIRNINSIDTGNCPSGGCWERLIYITELVTDAYVIQLDSDTISLGPLLEISNAISENKSFIIGNPKWPLPINSEYLNRIVSQWNSTHVQPTAEKNFKFLDFFQNGRKYIRGCAAFTGFSKNSVSKSLLEEFSIQIENKIGASKWSEWGSEQVASNVMLANSDDTVILPWPRFQNYGFPQAYSHAIESAALIHFIGSNRYFKREYEKRVKYFLQYYTA